MSCLDKPSAYVPPSLRGRASSGSPHLPVGLDPSAAAKIASNGKPKPRLAHPKAAAATGQALAPAPIVNSLGVVLDQPGLTEAGRKMTQKERLVRNITKKLDQINALKEKQKSGAPLEDDQASPPFFLFLCAHAVPPIEKCTASDCSSALFVALLLDR